LPNGQLAHKLATWSGGVAQKGGVWRGLHEFLLPGNLTKLIKSLLCRFARPAAAPNYFRCDAKFQKGIHNTVVYFAFLIFTYD